MFLLRLEIYPRERDLTVLNYVGTMLLVPFVLSFWPDKISRYGGEPMLRTLQLVPVARIVLCENNFYEWRYIRPR